jgi:molecular chaperone DnaK (HSP70)
MPSTLQCPSCGVILKIEVKVTRQTYDEAVADRFRELVKPMKMNQMLEDSLVKVLKDWDAAIHD